MGERVIRHVANEGDFRMVLSGAELGAARATNKSTPRTRYRRLVYFAAAPGGPIKIGMTCDARRRVKELARQTKTAVHLLATTDGGSFGEGAYHRKFAAHRLHGEWFARCPEIEAEIARLSSLPLNGGEA